MLEPGHVVVADFVGAMGVKRRPAVVVSSQFYHTHRPDLILAVLTTQAIVAPSPTDYALQDWTTAGLHQPSTFRAYFSMTTPVAVHVIGRLSERDWQAVQERLRLAIAI